MNLEISCQQASELLDQDHPPILIDCREPQEYEICKIKGSILVPMSDFTEKVELLFQDKDQSAIVYCHHGVRSLYATQYLHQIGFTNTMSMSGGIDVWSKMIDSCVPRY